MLSELEKHIYNTNARRVSTLHRVSSKAFFPDFLRSFSGDDVELRLGKHEVRVMMFFHDASSSLCPGVCPPELKPWLCFFFQLCNPGDLSFVRLVFFHLQNGIVTVPAS